MLDTLRTFGLPAFIGSFFLFVIYPLVQFKSCAKNERLGFIGKTFWILSILVTGSVGAAAYSTIYSRKFVFRLFSFVFLLAQGWAISTYGELLISQYQKQRELIEKLKSGEQIDLKSLGATDPRVREFIKKFAPQLGIEELEKQIGQRERTLDPNNSAAPIPPPPAPTPQYSETPQPSREQIFEKARQQLSHPVTLTGRIISCRSGTSPLLALSTVQLTLTGPDGKTIQATPNSSGDFTVQIQGAGRWKLTTQGGNFIKRTVHFDVASSQSTLDLGTIELE